MLRLNVKPFGEPVLQYRIYPLYVSVTVLGRDKGSEWELFFSCEIGPTFFLVFTEVGFEKHIICI